ncbi:MAG: lipid-A-disaccharide synthase, partial [Pseudomonadota bacterium]
MSHAERPRVALVAGELSGDRLGAGLIRALRASNPDITCEGVGGPAMRAAGCEVLFDCEELAVMGLVEVVRHLPRLLRRRRELLRHWQAQPPDVFVGIDAPDFNLGLARRLKLSGVPTVHYVCPSVWAWREKRVK